jgi:hyperosmotically inducible protein
MGPTKQFVVTRLMTMVENLTQTPTIEKRRPPRIVQATQHMRPSLKPDAESAVKGIEGVETVVNNIEVLPPSPHDDRIRRATHRAIYRSATLQRNALQAAPPIHIIVKNGHITLEGVVANQEDKDVANIRARGVAGSFSVTNNLAVETN